MTSAQVSLQAVSKRYAGRSIAVKDVSLTLDTGEVLGLVGANGSGKSTLLGILAAQLPPSSGKLMVSESIFGEIGGSVFRHTVGLATQDRALDPELTVAETLEFFAALFAIGRGDRARRIRDTVAQLEIGSFELRQIHQLSGGQRQRVHLALLFLQDPKIMLLDEPTAGLDMEMRAKLLQMLQATRHKDRIIVIATHELEGLEHLLDRVAFLSKGSLLTVNTPKNLLHQHGTLAQAYSAICGEPLRDDSTNMQHKPRVGSGPGRRG